MPYRDVDPEAAQQLFQSEPDLVRLDVRTPPEHHSHRLAKARLIPVGELAGRLGELDPSRPHLVVCEHGVRSLVACQILAEHGFDRLWNLRGGMARWLGAGLPVERG
ncbi:MAG: rhodanese-like domain-containing protein [Planctomycetes bacterium]|nr:rhodanese-like domain-containing protein [Planctomycetota bacterium]